MGSNGAVGGHPSFIIQILSVVAHYATTLGAS
jgi:hypothetical protein